MTRMIRLAACIVRAIIYEEDHRIQRCIFLEKAIWGSRDVWKKYLKKMPEGIKYLLLSCKFVLCDSLKLCAVKACKLLSKFLNK